MFQIQTFQYPTIKGHTIKDFVGSTLAAIFIPMQNALNNNFFPVPFLVMMTKPATVANQETTCIFLESKSTTHIVLWLAGSVKGLEKLCSIGQGSQTTMINLTLIGSRVPNGQFTTIPMEDTFPKHSSQQMFLLRCMNPVKTAKLICLLLQLQLYPG